MKTITQRFKELNDRLFKVENKLFEISKEIAITKETSNVYWSSVTRRLKEQYEIARFIYADWVNTNLPLLYDANIRSHIKRIKSMTFKPPFQLNYKEFVNNNINIQSKRIITSTAYSDYDIGLDSGAKKLNRLVRSSQQVNITEKELNQAITEGFSQKKSLYGMRKKVQETLLNDALDKKYITVVNKNGVPVDYNIKSYAKLVARTKYIQAQSDGVVNLATAYGSDLVQVSSHNTETPYDAQFEGKIFSLSGEDKRFPPATDLPPFHPNSYSKDTEVYTLRGWVRVKDITINDLCLSLNPENFNLEYVNVIKTHKHKENKMIQFKNRISDICVTKDHNMFYQTDWNSKKNKNRFKFIKANKLLNKKSGRFYASSKWEGVSYSLSNVWYEFFGYYLSEGNTEKCSENSYKIKISQSKKKNLNKYNKIYNCLKILMQEGKEKDKHICCMDGGFVFYDKELGIILYELGKSFKKYIPSWIMDSEKEKIRIFLDAFCLGDGHIRQRKWEDYNFNPEKEYFTTSKQMADQLSELILKIGKRPSYYIDNVKNKKVKFRNGTYKINNNLYKIRECHHNYISLQNMKIKEIDYNDYAYCVTLEKYHTLFTKRNGKCVWSGNCRHSLTVYFAEAQPAETLQKASDFSLGKSEVHPTLKHFKPVSER